MLTIDPVVQQDSNVQNRISNRLIDLIDIVFGVVVGINFAMLFNNPIENFPSLDQIITLPHASLLVAYVAIILSWMGYHQMMEHDSYTLKNRWGYLRFSIDVIIVFVYTVLMFSIKNTTLYLASFPVIFFLYALGGRFRNKEYGCEVSWSKGSLKYTAFFLIVLLIWWVLQYTASNHLILNNVPSTWILVPASWMLIFAVLALNLRYRYERAKQGFNRKK
jgi:hypothetical protein